MTCLEIDAQVADLSVKDDHTTPVGGLRNFTYHYLEDEAYCPTGSAMEGQRRADNSSARSLPPAEPALP